MQNRGQVTMFVVLGIIILVVIGIVILMSTSLKQETPFKVLSTEKEVASVREYVTSCLDESLKSGVSYCSGTFAKTGLPKCPDYQTDIAGMVVESFCTCIPNCIDFSMFKNIQVEAKGDIDIEAKLTDDKKKVTVTMQYPILVRRGESEHLLGTKESPFFAEYYLEQSSCALIKLKNNDYARCEADEDKTVEVLGLIFELKVGDQVKLGESCIAC